MIKHRSEIGDIRISRRTVGARGSLLALSLVSLLGLAAAQENTVQENTALPLSDPAESRTRAELLTLLDRVQTQIEGLPEGGRQADSARLTELRSQLELLLLQAQLEKLQRENATLKRQLTTQAQAAPSQDAQTVSALEQRMAEVIAQQENLGAQLEVVATQHAEILGAAAAPAEEEGETAEAGAGEQIHVVEPGDSLSRLAQTYYRNGARWPELLSANPSVTDPDTLLVGTELVIPSAP